MPDSNRSKPRPGIWILLGLVLLLPVAIVVSLVPAVACPICLDDPVIRHVDSLLSSTSPRSRCQGCKGRGKVTALRSWVDPMEIVSTDVSVWWAPLVTYDGEVRAETLVLLLESHGIMQVYIGGRGGQRMWVAFERHREAVELLRATPFSGKLRIHTIIGGPRPESHLPITKPGGPGETRWDVVGGFKNADLDPSKVLSLLNEHGCEAGLVTYGTAPDHTTIYVPATQADGARRAIRSSAFAENIKITY